MNKVDYFKNIKDFVTLNVGEVLFEQGDDGDKMYAVREGELDVFYDDVYVATIKAGQYLGEMAMVSERKRHAKVVAKTDCKLIEIDKRRFLYLVQETPTFAIQVMQDMVSSVERMNERITKDSEET